MTQTERWEDLGADIEIELCQARERGEFEEAIIERGGAARPADGIEVRGESGSWQRDDEPDRVHAARTERGHVHHRGALRERVEAPRYGAGDRRGERAAQELKGA